jgi:hypothetical protein
MVYVVVVYRRGIIVKSKGPADYNHLVIGFCQSSIVGLLTKILRLYLEDSLVHTASPFDGTCDLIISQSLYLAWIASTYILYDEVIVPSPVFLSLRSSVDCVLPFTENSGTLTSQNRNNISL